MLKTGSKRFKADPSISTGVPPAAQTYLVAERPKRVGRLSTPLRVLGNLLMITGLLTLLGIGGWYGYTTWENQRFVEELATKPGVIVAPATGVTAAPTVAALPTPLPPLNDAGTTTIAQEMLGVADRPAK